MSTSVTRREFVKSAAIAAAALAAGHTSLAHGADVEAIRRTPSFNSDMEYRRLGKTGLWVSAVALGGHWKRIDKMIKPGSTGPVRIDGEDRAAFDANRYDVLTRCMEVGINLVDACCAGEILAYSRALKGRRDKMYMAFSWYEKETRFKEWRTAAKLMEGLEDGMKAAGLEHVDIWRISAMMNGAHTQAEVEEQIKALDMAKKQGKARFTGFSSHNREWLKMLVETYPQQVEVLLTPYTADSRQLPTDSLFDAVRKHDVGLLGIKPFASNSLFKGDSSPNSPEAQEDDRRARLAIRYILANPAITAPIPGLISRHQVDNMVAALRERRQLDAGEKAELQQATREMWARLPEDYQWLREWRYV